MFLAGRALAQPAVVVLDPLIDWKNPKSLTVEQIQQFFDAQPAVKQSGALRVGKVYGDQIMATLSAAEDTLVMKIGARGANVSKMVMSTHGKFFAFLKLHFEVEQQDQADFALQLVEDIKGLEGGPEPSFVTGQTFGLEQNEATGKQESVKLDTERFLWVRGGWHMTLQRQKAFRGLWLPWTFEVRSGSPIPMIVEVPVAAGARGPDRPSELKADLDPLLDFSTLWQTSAEQFEKRYIARTREQQQEPPQFEWLTGTKDRARFSRQMFVDTPTTLTLFGGAVKAEEAVVEFVEGKAGRATISIYNRGDAGQMGTSEFQALFKKVGQSLGEVLKVTPRRQMSAGTGAVKNVAWMWTSPLGVALLEHNDFEGTGRPEYLRLKVAAPDQADWTMGRMSLGVQRMTLQKNVTRDAAAGDIFIAGVPMVDQGAKGYCVAASCQRLLEYMRIPCDQHEMAQLLSVDVERGANAFEMQKSLAKVDQKFGVTFKPLVNPEQYFGSAGKRRVSLNQFTSIIKEHADKGVPLLWALGLGQFPEDPPLPNGGQVSGGHMRMIIGYNAAKNQVIFTDSWGAGHEKKRMKATDAYQATLGLYSMSPRGL